MVILLFRINSFNLADMRVMFKKKKKLSYQVFHDLKKKIKFKEVSHLSKNKGVVQDHLITFLHNYDTELPISPFINYY